MSTVFRTAWIGWLLVSCLVLGYFAWTDDALFASPAYAWALNVPLKVYAVIWLVVGARMAYVLATGRRNRTWAVATISLWSWVQFMFGTSILVWGIQNGAYGALGGVIQWVGHAFLGFVYIHDPLVGKK